MENKELLKEKLDVEVSNWLWNYNQNSATTAMLVYSLIDLIQGEANKARIDELERVNWHIKTDNQALLPKFLDNRLDVLKDSK